MGGVKLRNLWSHLCLRGYELMKMKVESSNDFEEKKRELLEELVLMANSSFNHNRDRILEMLEEVKKALLSSGYEVKVVKAKLKSRGIFGASSSFGVIPFEVGLIFDPLLNVPFIPGSSIKGAVRTAYYDLCKDKGPNEEKCKQICERIFGGEKSGISLVGFTDAYPVKAGKKGYILYPDVMTPHYKDVKSELDLKLTPIIHLTVAPSTMFQFYIFYKKKRGNRHFKIESDIDFFNISNIRAETLGFLDLAVLYALGLGIGAKTRIGYSSFEIVKYEVVKG